MGVERRSGVLAGAVAGAVGGIIGSAVMVGFNYLLAQSGFGREDVGGRYQHRHLRGKPNETDGTIADEPGSEKVAARLVASVSGTPLDDRGRKIGGSVAHHAFGAVVGGLYGAAVARLPQLALGGGAPYGALVWLTAAETAMPLSGLARHPSAYPPERHAASLATHVVFGVTVEAARRWLSRTIR